MKKKEGMNHYKEREEFKKLKFCKNAQKSNKRRKRQNE